MANSNKTNKEDSKKFQVPTIFVTIFFVVEVVASLLAAYFILKNFTVFVAVAVAWFMLIKAAVIFVIVFHKAFKK